MEQKYTSLRSCPWKEIKMNGASWLLKSLFSTDNYEVLFTDFRSIWHEQLSKADITKRAKEINSSLEIEFKKLLEHVSEGLSGQSSVEFEVEVPYTLSMKRIVSMKLKLAGLPFLWKFHIARLDREQFYEHLTHPLMAMIHELGRQKREVIALVKNKDREIADMKAQGASVSKKKLETAVFDETAFDSNMMKSVRLADATIPSPLSAFSSENQWLYSRLMEKMNAQDSTGLSDTVPPVDVGTSSSSGQNSRNSTPNISPVKPSADRTKESELERRQALEQKLARDEEKEQFKKKKKLKL